MNKIEKYLSRVLVISSAYIIALILFGFYIFPGVFHWDYHFPLIIELLLKITATLAIISIFTTIFLILLLKIVKKPRRLDLQPSLVVSIVFIVCCGLLFLCGLYAVTRTCSGVSEEWYCNVEGKSLVGGLILSLMLASLAGFIVWMSRLFLKK